MYDLSIYEDAESGEYRVMLNGDEICNLIDFLSLTFECLNTDNISVFNEGSELKLRRGLVLPQGEELDRLDELLRTKPIL